MSARAIGVALLSGILSNAGAQGIHWWESEQYRGIPVKPGPFLSGTPARLVPRDVPSTSHEVYGYSTYWTSDEYLHFDLLTRIGIFDVTLNPDGTIANSHGFPQNWAWTIDRAHRNGVKCEMVATCFGGENITRAIRATSSIPNLVQLASSAGMDGINIDFEGIYAADRDTVVRFMRDLSAACRAAGLELTMATMPLDHANAYDFAALAETTDGLFMMEYNFHWQGCPEAGPTAPLFGWTYYGNLQMSLTEYLTEIGSGEKLLFGLPYYGFEWPTQADTTHSRTTGYGEAITYVQARSRAERRGRRWDEESKTPWYRYYDTGWHQGWYDDDTSLLLKYREVHEHGLLGTGIWTLGYDGSRRELWAALRESFNVPLARLENGDCEQWQLDTLAVPSDTSPNPVGWYEGRKARYRREDSLVHSGRYSIRHFPDSLGFSWPAVSVIFQDVRVAPGTAYQFSSWARKNDGRGNRMSLMLEWRDDRNSIISAVSSAALTRDSCDWIQLTTGVQAAPTSAYLARLCLLIEGYGGFDHWDDISFSTLAVVDEGGLTPDAESVTLNTVIVRDFLYLPPVLPACHYLLFSSAGQKIGELHPGANDLSSLAPGVYVLRLVWGKRQTLTMTRLVVVR